MATVVNLSDALKEKLAHLPQKPGVYLHKDVRGNVLYVGKAKNLRSRVRSYFQENRPRKQPDQEAKAAL